ncbi:hypothetical protein [Bacteroides rodentium]
MNMEKEMMYEAPTVEVLEVEVEVGFDGSQTGYDPTKPPFEG